MSSQPSRSARDVASSLPKYFAITDGPQVLGALPAAGKRGETREVEFVGVGVATGAAKLESVKRRVVFPSTPTASFDYRLETPWGTAPVSS